MSTDQYVLVGEQTFCSTQTRWSKIFLEYTKKEDRFLEKILTSDK